MHELAIMENVLDIVLDFGKQNHAKEIRQVNLVAGSLSGIIPHWAELFFRMIAKGTAAQEAKLSFRVTPARITCRSCGQSTEFTSAEMCFCCGDCGSDEVALAAGKEFHIDSIEVIVDPSSE